MSQEFEKLVFYSEGEIYDTEKYPYLDDPRRNIKNRESNLNESAEERKRKRKKIVSRVYHTKKRWRERVEEVQITRLGTLYRITSPTVYADLKENFRFIAINRPDPADPTLTLPPEEICFLKDLEAKPAEEIPPGGMVDILKLHSEVVAQLEKSKSRNRDLQRENQQLHEAGAGVDPAIIVSLKDQAKKTIDYNLTLVQTLLEKNIPTGSAEHISNQYVSFMQGLLDVIEKSWKPEIE